MNIFILNTDKRLVYLYKKLKKENLYSNVNKINLANFDEIIYNANNQDFLIFPPNFKITKEQANLLPNSINIVCGNFLQVKDVFDAKSIKTFNLMEDETFVLKNAILTAEGFLVDLISNTPSSIYNQKILILGGGRVAKAVGLLLYKLGISFDITMRNEQKLISTQLYASNILNWNNFKNYLKTYDTIINTIPIQLFDEGDTKKFKDNATIFELSSIKCFDEKALEKINQKIDTKMEDNSQNINFVFSPGLPGKYTPQSAGDLIFEYLKNIFVL